MAIASRIARARRLGLAAASLLFISLIATTAAADALPTATELTASSAETLFGEPVTLTAKVRAPGGTVEDGPGGGHLALHYHHSCAVMTGGTVKCWGYDSNGVLGSGSPGESVSTPTEVTDLTGVTALATSIYHICAIITGGTVTCWGNNSVGQLGDGTRTDRYTPTVVPGLSGVTALALGTYHSCARISDGTVKCWGSDVFGVLGDGTPNDYSLTPTEVPSLNGVSELAAGEYHSCALVTGGTVKCWGYNAYGQLGDGSRNDHYTPTEVPGLSGVKALSLSAFHSCAVISDGTVKCWGDGAYGLFGEAAAFETRLSPTDVPGVSGVSAFDASDYDYCALIKDATVKCWGYNGSGELGDGTNDTRYTPAEVPGLNNVVGIDINNTIYSGNGHACALLRGGSLKCWGYNASGQLGDGTNINRSSPVSVFEPVSGDVSFLDGTTVIGSGNLANGAAQFGTSMLEVGQHTLKAVFGGTASFAASESAGLNHTVLDGEDKVPPQIEAPKPFMVSTDPGTNTAVVPYQVSATDNVDGPIEVTLVSGLASGAEFPLGPTLVEYSATDKAGNKATASFTVTVEDGEAPEITVPDDITVTVAPGVPSAVVTYSVSANDNVGVVSLTLESGFASGEAFPLGDNQVTYMASDAAGNTSTASFMVTVKTLVTDKVPPVVSVPANITVANDPCVASAVVTYPDPTATDDVDGPVTPYLTAGLPSGSTFPVGVTTVTWSAKDAAQNVGSASFTVTVNNPNTPTDGDDVLTGSDASETLYGLKGNDKLCALGGNDKLYGGPGNDWLDGSSGADDMYGEDGDDTYLVDNAADRVFEREHRGWNAVHSSVTFQLPHNVDELQLKGSEPINGYGNEKGNRIIGNSAANRLFASGGDDYVEGKDGADFMDGGSGEDTLSYATSAAAVTADLASEKGTGGDAEGDTFDRFQNILGSPQPDTLLGDKWRNKIGGGLGGDTLTGRDGKDDFVYAAINESLPDQPDVITDFSKGDEIDLRAVDAVPGTPLVNDAFKFIGAAAFSKAGQLRFEGGKLLAEVNGDGVADMAIVLSNVSSIKSNQIEP